MGILQDVFVAFADHFIEDSEYIHSYWIGPLVAFLSYDWVELIVKISLLASLAQQEGEKDYQ